MGRVGFCPVWSNAASGKVDTGLDVDFDYVKVSRLHSCCSHLTDVRHSQRRCAAQQLALRDKYDRYNHRNTLCNKSTLVQHDDGQRYEKMNSAKLLSGNSHPRFLPIPSLLEIPIRFPPAATPPPDNLDGLGARLGEREGEELAEREIRCLDDFPRGVVVPSSAFVRVGEERKSALDRREGRDDDVVLARGVGVVDPVVVSSVIRMDEGVRGGSDAMEDVMESTSSSPRSNSPSSEKSSSSVVVSLLSLPPSSLDVPLIETNPPLRLLVNVSLVAAFLSPTRTKSSQSASEVVSSSVPVSLSNSLAS